MWNQSMNDECSYVVILTVQSIFFPLFFIASFLGKEGGGVEGDVRIIVSLENLKIASQNALRTLQWGKEMHGGYKSSISINF